MNWSLPPSHPGADDLVVEVLGEGRPFLPELGMAGCRDVVHGIQSTGISLECQPFSQAAFQFAYSAVHGARFGSAQVLTVLTISLINKFSVEVLSIGKNDCTDLLGGVGFSSMNNQAGRCAGKSRQVLVEIGTTGHVFGIDAVEYILNR